MYRIKSLYGNKMDYRGEWMTKIEAIPTGVITNHITGTVDLTYEDCPFKEGDRAFQAYLEKVEQCSFVEVRELAESERGSGGFGSTGAK